MRISISKINAWIVATFVLTAIIIPSFLSQYWGTVSGLSVAFSTLYFDYDGPASFVFFAVTCLALFCVDKHGKMGRMLESIANNASWLALSVFLLTALGAWFVYHAHPLAMDEYAPTFQSKIFASGHLVGNVPKPYLDTFVFKAFQGVFLEVSHASGAVASAYWPGLALTMTPFTLLGVTWLCNPVLSGLTILLLARLLDEIVTSPAAKGYALLATALSPAILVNGMSFYGMPLQLLCCIGFTLGMVRATPRSLCLAGFAGALSMTAVNPFPFFLYALPWTIWFFLQKNKPAKLFLWVVCGGLPIILGLGLGWKLLVLHTFQDEAALKTGAVLGAFALPANWLLIARGMAFVKLWLWAVPGLISLAIMAYFFKSSSRWVAIFMWSGVVSFVGYFFVAFDQGHGWGYRYFHTPWLVLPVLAAIAFEGLERTANARQRLYGFALASCVGTAILLLPFKAFQVEAFVAESLDLIPPKVAGNARQLVFLRPVCGLTNDLVQNTPFFDGNELRLVSLGPDRDKQAASSLGKHPRVVQDLTCAQRWLLD